MKLSKLTKPELDRIIENANFTEEEEQIFRMLTKGNTISEIAYTMSICDRTVNRKISCIRDKISRVKGDGDKWL